MLVIKKKPNFLHKLPKKYPNPFNLKNVIFLSSPKLLLNIWATFAKNFVPKSFQKSLNLVTLLPKLFTGLDKGNSV